MVNTAIMLVELRNELFAFVALFDDGEGFTFGRTRRIRTADLYHVKADWPHQDTRGRSKTSA